MSSSVVPTRVSAAHALVAAAATAPSILNTQPWSFEIRDHTVELYEDPDRAVLRRIDPMGRQLTISCGAAECSAGDTEAALLARADAALYDAKRGGRDRVATKDAAFVRDLISR